MENTANSELIVARAQDFGPITLQRPMRLFKRKLGLVPQLPGIPTLDFLVEAAFGNTSGALVREVLGDEQKNYEHASRGLHSPKPDTLVNIQKKLGPLICLFPSQQLDLSIPLAPALLALIENIEAQFLQSLDISKLHERSCPHCHHQVVPDPALWWERTGLALDAPAYRFVDRLLKGLVAWEKIGNFLLCLCKKMPNPDNAVVRLLSDRKGPQSLWLRDFTRAANVRNLLDLHAKLEVKQISSRKESLISYDLLLHWSSTRHLIPVRAVSRLLGILDDPGSLKKRQFLVRHCELVCDLVRSTAAGAEAPSMAIVRDVVLRRFKFLSELELALTVSDVQPK